MAPGRRPQGRPAVGARHTRALRPVRAHVPSLHCRGHRSLHLGPRGSRSVWRKGAPVWEGPRWSCRRWHAVCEVGARQAPDDSPHRGRRRVVRRTGCRPYVSRGNKSGGGSDVRRPAPCGSCPRCSHDRHLEGPGGHRWAPGAARSQPAHGAGGAPAQALQVPGRARRVQERPHDQVLGRARQSWVRGPAGVQAVQEAVGRSKDSAAGASRRAGHNHG
mmetsp:Transcript_2177/g.5077  ORF Transcript_2177/g.5077 Transcript_2177/m.5077 type:complete len:218 (-) Transcript_2177:256-909(-)